MYVEEQGDTWGPTSRTGTPLGLSQSLCILQMKKKKEEK